LFAIVCYAGNTPHRAVLAEIREDESWAIDACDVHIGNPGEYRMLRLGADWRSIIRAYH
jgi:hypothetical protein